MQESINKKEEKKQKKHSAPEEKSFFSELMESLEEAHDFAKGNKRAGTKVTKRHFEPVKILNAREIRKIRNLLGRTQLVFSEMLGVTPKAVEAWESGKNRPSKTASRMLQLLVIEPKLFSKLGLESEEKVKS